MDNDHQIYNYNSSVLPPLTVVLTKEVSYKLTEAIYGLGAHDITLDLPYLFSAETVCNVLYLDGSDNPVGLMYSRPSPHIKTIIRRSGFIIGETVNVDSVLQLCSAKSLKDKLEKLIHPVSTETSNPSDVPGDGERVGVGEIEAVLPTGFQCMIEGNIEMKHYVNVLSPSSDDTMVATELHLNLVRQAFYQLDRFDRIKIVARTFGLPDIDTGPEVITVMRTVQILQVLNEIVIKKDSNYEIHCSMVEDWNDWMKDCGIFKRNLSRPVLSILVDMCCRAVFGNWGTAKSILISEGFVPCSIKTATNLLQVIKVEACYGELDNLLRSK